MVGTWGKNPEAVSDAEVDALCGARLFFVKSEKKTTSTNASKNHNRKEAKVFARPQAASPTKGKFTTMIYTVFPKNTAAINPPAANPQILPPAVHYSDVEDYFSARGSPLVDEK